MIKNILSFLTITFAAFLLAPMTYACDTYGCILGSDSPIIGEVISQAEDSIDIKIISAFPGNKVKTQEDDQIKIKDFTKKLTVGKKYLIPLEKNDENSYIVPRSYAIFEVTGSSYLDAKLVKNKSIDDQALQIFINSGGKRILIMIIVVTNQSSSSMGKNMILKHMKRVFFYVLPASEFYFY